MYTGHKSKNDKIVQIDFIKNKAFAIQNVQFKEKEGIRKKNVVKS